MATYSKVTEAQLAEMRRMYNEGTIYEEMAEALNLAAECCRRHCTMMRKMGLLPERTRVRGKGKSAQLAPSAKEIEAMRKAALIDVLEDNGTGGVKCTVKVARSCIYGAGSGSSESARCNYCLITGKCRTVKDGESGYESPGNCHQYVKITKNNPRLEVPRRECDLHAISYKAIRG